MGGAVKKLNRYGNSHAGYYSRPLNLAKFGSKQLSASRRLLSSVICGFSISGKPFESTYREIEERYRISHATVGRFIKWAVIEDNPCFQRGEKIYQYEYIGETSKDKEFFIVYEWLKFAEFEIPEKGIKIRLTPAQIEVLSYIRGFMPNGLKCTRNYMAKKLGLSHDTVATAVRVLEAIGAIEGIEPEGGVVNGTTRTLFRSKENFLKKKRKEVVRNEKPQSLADRAAAEAAARERYYARVQNIEHDRISALEDYLRQDQEYAEAADCIRKDEIDIEAAKHKRDFSALTGLLEHRKKMIAQKLARMKLMEVSEQELEAKYRCEACKDTGERADHTYCDCWRRAPR